MGMWETFTSLDAVKISHGPQASRSTIDSRPTLSPSLTSTVHRVNHLQVTSPPYPLSVAFRRLLYIMRKASLNMFLQTPCNFHQLKFEGNIKRSRPCLILSIHMHLGELQQFRNHGLTDPEGTWGVNIHCFVFLKLVNCVKTATVACTEKRRTTLDIKGIHLQSVVLQQLIDNYRFKTSPRSRHFDHDCLCHSVTCHRVRHCILRSICLLNAMKHIVLWFPWNIKHTSGSILDCF